MEYKCEIIESKERTSCFKHSNAVSVENLPPLIGQAYGKIMTRMEEHRGSDCRGAFCGLL